MHSNSIIEIDDGNFENEVIGSTQPVLVEFADEEKRIDLDLLLEMSERYAGRARVAHVDTAVNYDAPCAYGVRQTPSVLLFQNGHVVDRLVGREARDVYCHCIDEALSPSWVI